MHIVIVVAAGVLAVSMLLLPALAFAQGQEDQWSSRRVAESFVFLYCWTVITNLYIQIWRPKQPNWIFTIRTMCHIPREGARTIIRYRRRHQVKKFLALGMYGDQSMRYWVSVNPRAVSPNLWQRDGLVPDQPFVTHTENSGWSSKMVEDRSW